MRFLPVLCAAAAALSPDMALAHEAFGDLGPFYMHMLHPAVDPGQGLLLAGIGALLARQPIEAVRPAYAAFALAGGCTLACLAVAPLAAPSTRLMAAIAIFAGVLAAVDLQLPRWITAVLCAAVAIVAAMSFDLSGTTITLVQKVIGGALGLAVAVLFVWGTLDWAVKRLHPIAPAVAGSWIAAVGLLVLALPG